MIFATRRFLPTVPRSALCLALCAAAFFSRPAAATLTYRYFAGKDTVLSACRIVKDGGGTVITTEWKTDTAAMTHELRIDGNGADRSWKAVNRAKGTDVLIVKVGDSLVLSGTLRRGPVSKSYPLGGAVWKQMMPFDLTDFAMSNDASFSFTGIALLGPYALKPYTLKARRMGDDTVDVLGSRIGAVRIRISPAGLLSALWHGDYWFRKTDGTFVKSVSSGMPGGPGATMLLAGER
jgi:hypothetical protein